MEKTTEANVEHFKVYIDESILYEQQEEMMIARRFIVAFYTIKAKDIERLNCAYKQTIYANKATHEKKSNQVSDKTNRQALEIAQNYLVNATVLERSAIDYSQFGAWKKNMYLSLELLSYIQPIKNILWQLKNCAKTAEIIVDVVIDRTSQNCIDPCLSLNKQLLDRLAQEVSDSDNCVVINYQTVDSKESYGIQVADMFAGAYRKELSYHRNEPLVSLILFPYQRKILDSELKQNSDFLKILGQLVYEQMPQDNLPAPQVATNGAIVKSKSKWSCHPITFLRNLFKRKDDSLYVEKDPFLEVMDLLRKLKTVNNKRKRKKIIALCCNLNTQLDDLVKRARLKPHAFAATLSKKLDDKHYERTLVNLRHNLKQMNKTCINKSARKFMTDELKAFNTKIKKYC